MGKIASYCDSVKSREITLYVRNFYLVVDIGSDGNKVHLTAEQCVLRFTDNLRSRALKLIHSLKVFPRCTLGDLNWSTAFRSYRN